MSNALGPVPGPMLVQVITGTGHRCTGTGACGRAHRSDPRGRCVRGAFNPADGLVATETGRRVFAAQTGLLTDLLAGGLDHPGDTR